MRASETDTRDETDTREMWRLIGGALLFAVVCGGAALAALRADAQPAAVDGPPPPAAVHEQLPAAVNAQPPAVAPARGVQLPAATAAPAGSAAPGEIPDDATVAPDSRQKADNNVSFPVDI